MTETTRSPEESRKEVWLKNLANFIVIANGKTWAAGGAEVEPRRPGYTRLQWPYPEDKMTDKDKRDYAGWENWRSEDEFTGFFRAPGMTTIYYKNEPAWTMQYGGHGQTEGYEDRAEKTFELLRRALMQVSEELPIRGPQEYIEGNNRYEFEMLEGNMEDGLWKEKIIEDGVQTFAQTGLVGIIIQIDKNKQPIYPWDL